MFGLDSAKLLLIGGAALALLALGSWAYDSIGDARERTVRAEWLASDLKNAEDGRKAVDNAVANANARRDKEDKDRKEREAVERQAQYDRAEEAIKKASALDRRYRDALIHNASCAAQMEMPVLCPLE